MPAWNELLLELQESAVARDGPPDFDGIRRKYLASLHSHTRRNVILYASRFTSQDAPGPAVSIVDEDMNGIMTVVHGLKGRTLDLVLHSPGGSLEAAESLVEYLRSKFSDIRVIVPQLAMSAATMIACSANSVLLGKHSFLGPIDPQILIPSPLGGLTYAPAQAILDQFDRAICECQDPKKLPAWVPMLQQYGPHLLVACENASALSEKLVADWLERWMFRRDTDKKAKAKKIAAWLANHRDFKSHGRHIPRWRLEHTGFRVERPEKDRKLQDAVLSVLHACTHTFAGTPAAKIIENHCGVAFIKMHLSQQQMVQLAPAKPPGPKNPPSS
jgi:hypothetical protein